MHVFICAFYHSTMCSYQRITIPLLLTIFFNPIMTSLDKNIYGLLLTSLFILILVHLEYTSKENMYNSSGDLHSYNVMPHHIVAVIVNGLKFFTAAANINLYKKPQNIMLLWDLQWKNYIILDFYFTVSVLTYPWSPSYWHTERNF